MSEIIIPELEDAMEHGDMGKFGQFWTSVEEATLSRYYGKVDTDLLVKNMPSKTKGQIQAKASRMGLTNRWKK
jgi:hypothetical protein